MRPLESPDLYKSRFLFVQCGLESKPVTRRQPFSTAAKCILPDGSVHPCKFADASASKATLYFPMHVPDLPKRFIADLSGNIEIRRACELIWQKGPIAGVAFFRVEDKRPARPGPSPAPA